MKGDRSAKNGEYPTLTAEHADGWHNADAGGPHPRCPECRREAKARADAERARLEGLRHVERHNDRLPGRAQSYLDRADFAAFSRRNARLRATK